MADYNSSYTGSEIDAGIEKTATSPLTGWSDMLAPLSAAGVPSANAPSMTAFGPTGFRDEFAFAINDYLHVQPFHVNHDAKPSGEAYFHIHWSTDGTSTATVKWEFTFSRALGHNQAAFGTPTVITVEQAASGTAWQHMVAEVATPITLVEPDELILCNVKRITNGGTDNADTVFGLMADMHYQADRHTTLNKAPNFYA